MDSLSPTDFQCGYLAGVGLMLAMMVGVERLIRWRNPPPAPETPLTFQVLDVFAVPPGVATDILLDNPTLMSVAGCKSRLSTCTHGKQEAERLNLLLGQAAARRPDWTYLARVAFP